MWKGADDKKIQTGRGFLRAVLFGVVFFNCG